MKITLKHFPYIVVKPIPSCKKTRQVFLLPGLMIGRGYFTFFWWRKMLTVNFNTSLVYDNE